MNETMNINHVGGESNYRLRGEPVKLFAKEFIGFRPDGDGWEDVWKETNSAEHYATQMKLKGSRRQRAARQMIPLSTVTIVNLRTPAPPTMVRAILDEKSPDEIRIAELEAKVKELLGLVTK